MVDLLSSAIFVLFARSIEKDVKKVHVSFVFLPVESVLVSTAVASVLVSTEDVETVLYYTGCVETVLGSTAGRAVCGSSLKGRAGGMWILS
jgi:hypothetical protein